MNRSKKILEIFGKNDEIKADGFRRRSEGSLKIEKMVSKWSFELETLNVPPGRVLFKVISVQ